MEKQVIENNSLKVAVNSFGAELSSVKDKNGHEFIWQAEKSLWARHAPVLFPIVGKLKEDKYQYKGKSYSMMQHGFARDKEFILVEQTNSILEYELTATDESLSKFPFHFSLRIRYELSGYTLKVTYTVFNPNNSELLFSIGAHPGFNCLLNESELLFSSKKTLVAHKLKNGAISEEIYELNTENGKLKLSTEVFDHDALVFKSNQIEEVTLKSGKYKIKLTCNNWPYFGIWSKKDCNDFVCLEPWHGIADSISSNGDLEKKEGIIKLPVHKSFECSFELNFTSNS